MPPHSSTLAWKIPWMGESGRLQSIGLWRVGHDWATSPSLCTFMHWRRKWQPTPVSCLENPRDGGAWWAAVYGVAQSRTRLKQLSSSSSSRAWGVWCGILAPWVYPAVICKTAFFTKDDTQAPEAGWLPCGHSVATRILFLILRQGSFKYIMCLSSQYTSKGIKIACMFLQCSSMI